MLGRVRVGQRVRVTVSQDTRQQTAYGTLRTESGIAAGVDSISDPPVVFPSSYRDLLMAGLPAAPVSATPSM